jgi:hypothetical protein
LRNIFIKRSHDPSRPGDRSDCPRHILQRYLVDNRERHPVQLPVNVDESGVDPAFQAVLL